MIPNTKTITDFETGEEKVVNSGFSQIYHSWWKIQRSMIEEYPTALKVFSWLIEAADRRNAIVVSYSAMSKAIGMNSRTVMRAVSYLVEKKLISILKSGNMNVYILNDRIVWKDTADKKDKYSQFSAEVFIVASEQEEVYRTQLIGHAIPKPVKKMRTKKKNGRDEQNPN